MLAYNITENVDGQGNAIRGIRGLLHLSNALAPLARVLENSVQPPDAADVHTPRVASLVDQHDNRGAPAVPEEATAGGGGGGYCTVGRGVRYAFLVLRA